MPRIAKDKEEIIDVENKKTKKTSSSKTKQSKDKTNITTSSKIKRQTKSSSSETPTPTSIKKNVAKSKNKQKDFLPEYYDLPYKYNKTVVKILAQTPETLFVYWEISDDDRNAFLEKYGENFFETTTPILKVHNKTKNYTFEVEINDFANCWYLHINDSKCDYEIELDRKMNTSNNLEYIHISSSNNIELPNDHILFEQDLSSVKFRNVKTNEIIDVDVKKSAKNIYNIKNLYDLLYTKEELDDFKNLSNPSS